MKKSIAVGLVILVVLNIGGLLSLGNYLRYTASLVKNDEVSIFQALEYKPSNFNDKQDSETLEVIKEHIDNILHRSSNDQINKMVHKKLLGDIYGDLNYEYLDGKLKISPSSWGLNGRRVPEEILEKLDEKSMFWTNEDDLFKMSVLFLASGNNIKAYDYIEKAYEVHKKEEFMVVKAAILSDMKRIDESSGVLSQIEDLEEVSNQIEIYNSILQGDMDTLNSLIGFREKKEYLSKNEYEKYFKETIKHNYYKDQYLKMFNSITDFNRSYIVNLYKFKDQKIYRIKGHVLNDGKPLKNMMIQIGNHDYYSSVHLDEDSYVGYTNDNGEFNIEVPENIEYKVTVFPNLGDVKGKMCRMPKEVYPGSDSNIIEFIENDFDLSVVEESGNLDITWNESKHFDNYTIMIGSMKNGHPYNPEYYSKSIEGNSTSIDKNEIVDLSYSRSYSYGDNGRTPQSFFPVLYIPGTYFVDIRGNIDDSSHTQMDSDINGLYGKDQTYKIVIEGNMNSSDKLFLDKKYEQALTSYEEEASNGNQHSIAMLAHIYSYNDKIEAMDESVYNPEKAIRYLELSDEYRYYKYGQSVVDYKLYDMYEELDNLQGFINYLDKYEYRSGYDYSKAFFHLGMYNEGYETLLNYVKAEKSDWLIKHLVESGLFYVDIDRVKSDITEIDEGNYELVYKGLDELDKNEIAKYQELIKKMGIANIQDISIDNTDTSKIYKALLRINNGPYSSNDIKDIISSIESSEIKYLGNFLY